MNENLQHGEQVGDEDEKTRFGHLVKVALVVASGVYHTLDDEEAQDNVHQSHNVSPNSEECVACFALSASL